MRNEPEVGITQSVEKALARYEDSGAIPKVIHSGLTVGEAAQPHLFL